MQLTDAAGALPLSAGAQLDGCTFFNGFSHGKWRRTTAVDDVSLEIAGTGTVKLDVLAYTSTAAAVRVLVRDVELGPETLRVPIGSLDALPGEVLALTVTALTAATIRAAAWTTRTPALRDMGLAAVMVTYRREAAARDAIDKFASLTIPQADSPLHLYVIDNGQTLDLDVAPGVTILRNRNLGGAGGFARGLIEVKAGKRFTHALFMDDDASCEPESVWRCQAFLRYAHDPRTSMAGAMLSTERPTELHEKGAHFERHAAKGRIWTAIGQGERLSDAVSVVRSDGEDQANYGGWWFFAFPLDAVTQFPFPFFVRGDDTDFSLSNELPIVTLNGVASWCEDFRYKVSNSTEYLAYRSWLVLVLMHGTSRSAVRSLFEMTRHVLTFAFRFDYACMHAIIDAFEDVEKGPAFFAEHPAPIRSLQRVAARRSKSPITAREFAELRPLPTDPVAFTLPLGLLTLGGHLLPRRFMADGIPHARFAWEAGHLSLVRSQALAVGVGSHLAVYRRNRRDMLKGLARLLPAVLRISVKIPKLARAFRAQAPRFKTEAFWRQQLQP